MESLSSMGIQGRKGEGKHVREKGEGEGEVQTGV